mgnify:CR=1 FL=1
MPRIGHVCARRRPRPRRPALRRPDSQPDLGGCGQLRLQQIGRKLVFHLRLDRGQHQVVQRLGGARLEELPLNGGELPRAVEVAPGFVTLPGVFSADGPDPGSVALAAALPAEVIAKTSAKYREAWQRLTQE